ncbi:MAG: ATP-binding protein [Oscillospiraceae bacterium]|nr:ATP-binding protein [Oscillospiraceae bacterium]
MAKHSTLLRQAREIHRKKKACWEQDLRQRQAEVYARLPRIREIDWRLRETVAESIELAMTSGSEPEQRLLAIGQENQALQAESRALLCEAGYPPDYLDDTPLCLLCKDTGHIGPTVCTCLLELYHSLQARELSSLLNLGEENFEAFSLDYYDDRDLDPRFGTTARENMEMNYRICLKYAKQFGPRSGNLFLTGDPGLGKTFLSSCIAKAVSEAGFSVVYDTAGRLFSRFEAEKFGRGEDPDELQSEIDRYLGCDLLLLDDLGTEWVTPLVISTFYTLLNTRLLGKKQTVISSNYSLEALSAKYTPQILSRLEGEYEVLTFFGKDIRKLKKETLS